MPAAAALEGFVHDVGVCRAEPGERAVVRVAAEGDGLPDREVESTQLVLAQDADRACDIASRRAPQVVVTENHLTGRRFEGPIDGLEQSGLSAAVRSVHRDVLAFCDAHVDVANRRNVRVAGVDSGEGKLHESPAVPVALRRRTRRKTGTPKTAVRIPIGVSVGPSTTRAAAPAQTRINAPCNAPTGTARRWSAPTRSRARLGTTSPRKPLLPATAPAVPVSSVTSTSSTRRSRAEFRPRAEAIGILLVA